MSEVAMGSEQPGPGRSASPEADSLPTAGPTEVAVVASLGPEPADVGTGLPEQVAATVVSAGLVRAQRAKQEIDYGRRGKG